MAEDKAASLEPTPGDGKQAKAPKPRKPIIEIPTKKYLTSGWYHDADPSRPAIAECSLVRMAECLHWLCGVLEAILLVRARAQWKDRCISFVSPTTVLTIS